MASLRSAGPQAKAQRAKHHIDDLERAVKAFLDSGPYVIGTKRKPDTGQLVYYLTKVDPVPDEVAIIAGDALHCLRSALDHMAYQLVAVGTGNPGPHRHVEFPIFKSVNEYRTKKHGKVRGMRQDAKDAIDAIQPYGGGNEPLWQLHQLDIVDKHRLVIASGSSYQSLNVGRHVMRMFDQRFPGQFPTGVPEVPLFLRPADGLFPLQAGKELFVDAPEAEPDDKLQFRFAVALSEPGVVEAEPVADTLRELAGAVDNVLAILAPLV